MIKPIFVDQVLRGWPPHGAPQRRRRDRAGQRRSSCDRDLSGLRLPLLKLFEQVGLTRFRVIERNTRIPTHVLGDLRAQIAAAGLPRRAWSAWSKYGAEALEAYLEELQEQAERQMREEIAHPGWPIRLRGFHRRLARRPSGAHRGLRHGRRRRDHARLHGLRRRSTARSPWSTRPPTARSAASLSATSRTARATCARSTSWFRPAP